jgi:hypothetical protein
MNINNFINFPMKGSFPVYLVLFFFLIPDSLFSQANTTVTTPRLEVSGDNLIIQYDILNANSADFFIVYLVVTNAAGNKIKAISLSGDVGNDIKGGKNKKITWNFINDSIYIDEELFVEVKAEKVVKQEEIAETRKENEFKEENEIKEETKTVKPVEAGSKEFSKGKMILTSVALPGWGQTKINKGKPFWIIGAVGYGCIAGSVLMNRSAASAYDDYKLSMDPDESNALFDKATGRNNLSKVLGYSAIGIWAADIIWVLATPVRSHLATATQKSGKLRFIPGIETGSNVPIVSLTYNF